MGVTVSVDRVACNTSTGDQAITVSAGGLTPKAALFILVAATVDGTAAPDLIISEGWATASGSGNNFAHGGYSEDGVGTSVTYDWSDNDECIAGYDGGGTLLFEATLSSFGVNTVTINWANAPSSAWLLTVVTFSGTDVSVASGSFDVGNSTDNTIDITAPGFEPDILFTQLKNAGSAFPDQGAQMELAYGIVHNDGIGGITQRAVYWGDRDARATSELWARGHDNAGVVDAAINNGALDWYGEFTDFDANGFSMITRNNGGNALDVSYLAISFGGVVDSWVGTYSTPTSIGNDSDTGPGFKPQFLFSLNTLFEAVDTVYGDGRAGARGISALTADDQFSNSFNSEDGVGTMNTQSLSDDITLELPDDDGTTTLTATFVSFNATGWTWNYSAVGEAAKLLFVLAVEEEVVGFTQAISGTLNFGGTVVKKTNKSFSGILTSSGALIKKTLKSFTGTLTSSGAVSAIKKSFSSLTGVLTSSGTLSKKTLKSFTGILSSSGVVSTVKKSFINLVGTINPSGALVAIKTGVLYFQSLAGTLTSSGTLTKKTLKLFSGTLTSSGALTKKTIKLFSGTLTSSGSLIATKLGVLYFQVISGALSFSGTVVKKTKKPLGGILTSSGTLIKKSFKFLGGTLTSSGALAKKMFISLSGTLTSSGILSSELNLVAAFVALKLRTRSFSSALRSRTFLKSLRDRNFDLTLKDKD